MDEIKRNARVAGLLYLLIAIAGPFNLIYVPGKILVNGDAIQTVGNIVAHQSLYRWDLAVGLVSNIIFLFVALALYRLFRDTNQRVAAVMAVLVIAQIPQGYVCDLLRFGALELARGADYLPVMDTALRNTLAMLCLKFSYKGSIISEMFWGIWLFPLGWLVIRSGFLPRFLGYWLYVNGAAYVALSLAGLLLPQALAILDKVLMPALFGELAFLLWLLIFGATPRLAADTA
jgi:hypothetical protein